MKRIIETALKNWKEDTMRKVLLVRGARQVGKTYSIRVLGASFEYSAEINFEKAVRLRELFDADLNVRDICNNLAAVIGVPIVPGKTLLFFDEVQACPNALRALRFFYEELPELHVVAAGSLLEFALQEIPSFGVGRITSLYMYPMTFLEFLWAIGETPLADELLKASWQNPLNSVLHKRLLDLMRMHQIIGGMPSVVGCYCQARDILKCQHVLDDLLASLRDDFAKYAKRLPVTKLIETFSSVAYQAGGKFMVTRAAQDTSIESYKNALELLVRAGLVYKVYHTSAQGVPLGAQINEKKYKVIMFDIGVHLRLLGLELKDFLLNDSMELINKGNIAEIYAGIELIAGFLPTMAPQLFYWHREARASNAEIDYVFAHGSTIIPVEIKAKISGSMKSLHLFLAEREHCQGVRLSSENFSSVNGILIAPLYAASQIPDAMARLKPD